MTVQTSGVADVVLREWGAPAERADVAVLTVHGRGQHPDFMRAVSERFGATPVRFYAPRAQQQSWYPQSFLAPLAQNQPVLDRSLEMLDSCLDTVTERGFPAERVVLWGFSQGACLLAHHLCTKPQCYAGVLLFTGGYLGPEQLPRPAGEPLRGMSTVLRSRHDDPWVPPHRVAETALLLNSMGSLLDLRIEAGEEHVITDEACRTATNLLRTCSSGET